MNVHVRICAGGGTTRFPAMIIQYLRARRISPPNKQNWSQNIQSAPLCGHTCRAECLLMGSMRAQCSASRALSVESTSYLGIWGQGYLLPTPFETH